MTSAIHRSSLLLSLPFLTALAALLINDLYLKSAFPGLMTGKLSDFAGIYLVSLMAFYWFPQRRLPIGIALVVFFSWWKSPLSQPAIDAVNSFGVLRYGRVIDYTDLTGLVMIPVAILTLRHCIDRSSCRLLVTMPVAALTLLSILGTAAIMPVHEYSIRSADPEERMDIYMAYDAIYGVAQRNGLACIECDENAPQGTYQGKHVTLEYWLVEPARGIQFRVSSTKMKGIILQRPDFEELDRIRAELKAEFAHLAASVEYVESLPDYHQ